MATKPKREKISIPKEAWKLIRDFFRKDFISEEVLKEPKHVVKTVRKMNLFEFIMNAIIFTFFSYFVLIGNYFIENGAIVLGITMHMLFIAQDIVKVLYRQWIINMRTELEFAVTDSLTIAGGKILAKVSNHVFKKDSEHWVQVSNEEITNTIASYLNGSWKIRDNYWLNFAKVFTTFVMLALTVVTNTTIPQWKFILLLVVSTIFNFVCAAVDRYNHSNYKKEDRKLNNTKDVIKNDIVRVVPIIPEDQGSRIRRFQAVSQEQFQKKHDLINKDFITDIISRCVHVITSCILVGLYLTSSPEITLATVAGMTASLAIFNSAVSSAYDITNLVISTSKSWDEVNKEKEVLTNILYIYHQEVQKVMTPVEDLPIPAFRIQYNEKSENDKPFTLILDEELQYQKGDIVVLTGASGSGKSTFLKVVTSRIKFDHSEETEIKPIRYTYFDDSIDFGSATLYEELFCLDPKIRTAPSQNEISKMEYILKRMMVFQEVAENCRDFWQWTKEHNGSELSCGQKQRMIISKLLFWMNENVDIVALDECTSGLDVEDTDDENADAMKILKFIIEYCNTDKERIIVLSSHQDITKLCKHQLHFKRSRGQTIIQKNF